MNRFEQLQASGQNYFITRKKQFSPDGTFKRTTIEKVLQFAYDMTFGGKGQHRAYRSGGNHT